MAEPDVTLQASNLFGLSANFNTLSSSSSTPRENAQVLDESGNVSCQRMIDDRINYEQEAQYCGIDFFADMGTFLTEFGNVQNGKLVESITINATARDYCTISISGHNHAENAHVAGLEVGYTDMSEFFFYDGGGALIPWDGFGVPNVGELVYGPDASPASASYQMTMTHVDKMQEDGAHFVGKNITPVFSITVDFEGVPLSSTPDLIEEDFSIYVPIPIYVDDAPYSDSNSDFDKFSYTAHGNPPLATV